MASVGTPDVPSVEQHEEALAGLFALVYCACSCLIFVLWAVLTADRISLCLLSTVCLPTVNCLLVPQDCTPNPTSSPHHEASAGLLSSPHVASTGTADGAPAGLLALV